MIKKILALTLSLSMIFAPCSFAVVGVPDAPQHWVAAWFGGGGRYDMVVADKFTANKFYVITDVGSPYVSTDKGENWTWLSYRSANGFNTSQPTSFVQSKNNANLMFMIGGNSSGGSTGAILKSIDGGQLWTKVTSNKASRTSSGKVLAFDPTNDNTIYAALDNGTVLRSTDGGTTWPILFTPFGVNQKATWVYVNPTGTKVWVGGSNLGIKVWDVNSATLSTVTLAGSTTLPNYTTDYDTFIDGSAVENLCVATGVKIACTADEGTNWTYTTTAYTTANYYIGRFAVSYTAGTLNFVTFVRLTTSGQGGSIERYSNNSGTTWATVTVTKNTTMSPPETLTVGGRSGAGITHDPNDPTVFFYETDYGIFRSDNSGANFAEKDAGAGNTITWDITMSPNGILFACSMDVGCQRSTDNGTTWTQVVPTSNSNIGHYWRVKCAGTLADWQAGTGIVVVTSTRYTQSTATNYRNVPARSTDNGQTFTFITAGFPTVGLYGDMVWDHGYARAMGASATGQYMYIGMDGENCDSDGPGGVAYNCSTNQVTGGVFKSTDYGATWARANGNPTSPGASTPRKSYDALAVDPLNSQHIVYGTYGYNLYNSTNAGLTMGYVSAPSPNAVSNYIQNAAFDSAGHPYAVGTNSGPVIYKSVVTSYGNANGAYSTWILMKRFFPVTVTNGIAEGIAVDPNNDDRIFVSVAEGTTGSITGNRIFVTTDAHNGAAATWTDITGDLPAVYGCKQLMVNPSEGVHGYLYCASISSGVLKLDLSDSPTLDTGVVRIGQ